MSLLGGLKPNFRSDILHEYGVHTTRIVVAEALEELEELERRLGPLASDSGYEILLVVPDTEVDTWEEAKLWMKTSPRVRPVQMPRREPARMVLTALQFARGRYVQMSQGDTVVTYPKWALLAAVDPGDRGDLRYASQRLDPWATSEYDDPMLAYHGALCRAAKGAHLNVLCAVPNIVPNGAQRMALLLAIAVRDKGHSVEVVSTEWSDDDDRGWLIADLSPQPPTLAPLSEALGNPKYDVAISHVWPGVDRLLQVAPVCPALVVHHSCDVMVEDARGLGARLHAVVANPERANMVVPIQVGQAPPVAPFPNTAEPPPTVFPHPPWDMGADWSSEKIILCLTRAEPEKGGDILLEVAEPLSKLGHLVVAGLGDHQPLYHELKAELSRVGADALDIIPHSEVAHWLAFSDVLLFTSRREANSIALIEAAMAGVPVACTPGAAPHWWGVEKGWPVVVADSMEPAAIVDAVAATLSLGKPGAPYIPGELMPERVVERYERALELLAVRGVWGKALHLRGGDIATLPVHVVNVDQETAGFASSLRADVAAGAPTTMSGPTLRLLVGVLREMSAEVWLEDERLGQIIFDPSRWGERPSKPTPRVLCLPPIVENDGVDFWRHKLYDMGWRGSEDGLLQAFAPDGRVARAAATLYHHHTGGRTDDPRRYTRF